MAYPAPSRHRWFVAVEFLDGTRIEGTSDADVIDRWHRLGWELDQTRAEFKRTRVARARVIYRALLPGVDESTPDGEFLDAFDREGVIRLMRKL